MESVKPTRWERQSHHLGGGVMAMAIPKKGIAMRCWTHHMGEISLWHIFIFLRQGIWDKTPWFISKDNFTNDLELIFYCYSWYGYYSISNGYIKWLYQKTISNGYFIVFSQIQPRNMEKSETALPFLQVLADKMSSKAGLKIFLGLKNEGIFALNQWIGLRENLQETIDFPIKHGAFL